MATRTCAKWSSNSMPQTTEVSTSSGQTLHPLLQDTILTTTKRTNQNLQQHKTNLLLPPSTLRLKNPPSNLQTHHPRRSRRNDLNSPNGPPPHNGKIHSKHPLLHNSKLHPQTLSSPPLSLHEIPLLPSQRTRYPPSSRPRHNRRIRKNRRSSNGISSPSIKRRYASRPQCSPSLPRILHPPSKTGRTNPQQCIHSTRDDHRKHNL